MKITFLGTGTSQGIPIIGCTCSVCSSNDKRDKRLRSSIHIEINQKSIIIDTGPDFRYQVLRAGIKRLDAILFTHEHKDHIGGFDDIRPFNYLLKNIPEVFCSKAVESALRRDFYYAFAEEKYPGVPEFSISTIDEMPFLFGGEEIIPIPVMHHKMPVLGFRLRDFAYITDCNFIPETSFQKLRGLDTIVINALRKSEHISHFSLQQALEIIERINPRRAYLTHISHQLDLHSSLLKELPTGVEPAHDGLCIDFGDIHKI